MYYLYLLLCEDKSIYTGITTDLERRLIEHKTKSGGRYTRSHKAVKLLYSEKLTSQGEALKRERQIKGWRKEKKLNLIKLGNNIV